MKTNNAKMFPPLIDAYRTYENVTLKNFKEELLGNSLQWFDASIGRLFLINTITCSSEIQNTPFYVGHWGDKFFGVFAVTVNSDGYVTEKQIKEIDNTFYYDVDRT